MFAGRPNDQLPLGKKSKSFATEVRTIDGILTATRLEEQPHFCGHWTIEAPQGIYKTA